MKTFRILLIGIPLILPLVSQAIIRAYYSAADSTIYLQYPFAPPSEYALFRFTEGGSHREEASSPSPGELLMTDNIPGHLYTLRNRAEGGYDFSRTTDYGESWNLFPNRPGGHGYVSRGYSGSVPGEAGIHLYGDSEYTYVTSNGWESYDSVMFTRTLPEFPDPISFFSLTYNPGTIIGVTFPLRTFCVSSDTGRTWSLGGFQSPNAVFALRAGSRDEIWGFSGSVPRVVVISDTGHILRDSLFIPHPPLREYEWSYEVYPTPNLGEAYVLAEHDDWVVQELIIYHLQGYGISVDSTLHRFEWYHPVPALYRPYAPTEQVVTAYPNPFNPEVTIDLHSLSSFPRTVVISNILGQSVWIWRGTGKSFVWSGLTFQGMPAPSGTYFVRVNSKNSMSTIPIILLR